MTNRRNRRARHKRHKDRTRVRKSLTWGLKVTPELHRSIRCRVRFVGGPLDGQLQELDHEGSFHNVAVWPTFETYEELVKFGAGSVTYITYRRRRSFPVDLMTLD